MLNICGDSIKKLLGLIFRACLEREIFPQNWEKANVVPIHKKRQAINKEQTSFTSSNMWENF